MENKINLAPLRNPYLVKFNIAQKNLAKWEAEERPVKFNYRSKRQPLKPE